MSETVEVKVAEKEGNQEIISTEDLQRMLEESRNRETEANRREEAARARAAEAERERDTAHGRVANEAEQRWEAQKRAFDGNIAAAESDAERAEREYIEAINAGDAAAQAKAQRAIAKAEAQADRLRTQKEWLETQKPAEPQQPAGDKYAPYVKGLLAEERAWLDERPEFLSDPRFRAMVLGASAVAESKGNPRGTDAYFRVIERLIREEEAATDDGGHTPPPRTPPRAPSSDLPPQRRSGPGAAPSGGREISLTRDEAEVADGLYGNPQSPDYIADIGDRYRKYHANKLKMQERFGR